MEEQIEIRDLRGNPEASKRILRENKVSKERHTIIKLLDKSVWKKPK